MKWTKVALVLVIPALALLLLSGSMRTPAAQAKPTAVLTITANLCTTLTASDGDWDDDGDVDADDNSIGFQRCNTLSDPDKFRDLVAVLDGDPDDPEPEDFASIDRDLGHLHEKDGVMWIIAFLSNDDPVAFYADEGRFEQSGSASIFCGPLPSPDYDIEEEDCDGDGDRGDGVVVVKLKPGPDPDRGPATVRVRQGMQEMEAEYTIVGEPHDLELTVLQSPIMIQSTECAVIAGTEDFYEILDAPGRSVVTVKAMDDDGTVITGAMIAFETDDDYIATMAKPLTPTIDLLALGIGAPNTICGTVNPGTVTLTAKITDGMEELGLSLDGEANVGKKAKAEVVIQDVPTDMVLTADPPSLVCDGTAGSAVSAALTDADGNPAVDGTPVHFEAKTLGVADPMNARTAGGAATTTVTPVSAIGKGVVVRATMALQGIDWQELLDDYLDLIDPDILQTLLDNNKVPAWNNVYEEDFPLGDEVQVEGSLLIECAGAAPAVAEPAAPAGTTAPTISPPPTGDGGYSSGGQATSWWLTLPLGLGVALLAGGLVALRRRAL